MAAEHLKGLSARDLLVGIFYFLPEQCSLEYHDLVSYLIEKFDISAKDLNENLSLLCGANYPPSILKVKDGYYTIIENKRRIKKFIEPNFDDEQLKNLEEIASDLLTISTLDYR